MSLKLESSAVVPGDYFDWETFTTRETEFPTELLNLSGQDLRNVTTLVGRCKWNKLNTGMTILLFLTFLLNALSSIVLFRVPLVTIRGRSNPVYFCIRFLNACDVLQAFFLILMPAFATSDCGWMGGKLSCSIMGFIVLFFLLVSPLITILMALDRVVALYWPFKYRSNLGLKMLKVLLPSACMLVFITAILPIFGVGEYHVVKGRRFCLLDTITENVVNRSYVIAVHVIFLLALLFMLSCTIAFQSRLSRMSFSKKHKESKSKTNKKISSRRTRTATLTTMAVCCIFIVCYLPYVIRVLFEASTLKKSPSIITWMTFGLAFLQPLLNPIVYISTNTRYRREFQALVKNIKVSDWETSSESGANHQASRGAFSEFRRRLSNSNGSSRNSKIGSKRKHKESKNSLNNSATSPPLSHLVGSSVERRASCKRHSKLPDFLPDNCFKDGKITTHKSVGQSPKSGDAHTYREQSSSSGVKSFDSVERMLLTAPAIASSLAFQISDNQNELPEYGRSFRCHSGTFESNTRERSSTLSGEQKTQIEGVKESTRRHCTSTPELVDVGVSKQSPHESNDGDSSASILPCASSPMRGPYTVYDLPELDADIMPSASLMGHSDALDCSPGSSEKFPNMNDIACSDTQMSKLAKQPCQSRSPYNRVLELTSGCSVSRKPSKRDSGVGDS